jgi:hypothetical protein
MSVPHGVLGVVMHTQDGNNPGTVSWFNNPAAQASAHFCIAQDGSVVQMGSVLGWKAWAEADGNPFFYSLEFADNTHPATPLTTAQIQSGGQLVEVLARVGNFPLQVTDSPSGEGFGYHAMGGQAWGGHLSCPGDVRKAQRAAILAVAKEIRGGPPADVTVKVWTCRGELSLNALASQDLHNGVSTVVRLTAEHSPGGVFTVNMAAYINAVFATDAVKVPVGVRLWLGSEWFTATGHQTIQGIALGRDLHPAGILQSTAERSAGAVFAADAAAYVNGVFSRSVLKVPAGVHVYYQG